MENINKFLGKVSISGTGLVVTIPKRNAEYEGLEKGDLVWVVIRKATKEETENQEINDDKNE